MSKPEHVSLLKPSPTPPPPAVTDAGAHSDSVMIDLDEEVVPDYGGMQPGGMQPSDNGEPQPNTLYVNPPVGGPSNYEPRPPPRAPVKGEGPPLPPQETPFQVVGQNSFTNKIGYHVLCLFLSLGNIGGIVALILSKTLWKETEFAWIIALVGLIICYIAYVIESGVSPSRQLLDSIETAETVTQHADRLKTYAPALTFHLELYHYETRTRQVSSTDSNGNRSTRTETYTVKVTTYREDERFVYNRWQDISGQMVGVENYDIVRVKFHKCYALADSMSRSHYDGQRQFLVNRNRWRDQHFSLHESLDLQDFQPRMLCFRDPAVRPAMLSSEWYWFFSLIGLSWPYRYWFGKLSVKTEFYFVKELGI